MGTYTVRYIWNIQWEMYLIKFVESVCIIILFSIRDILLNKYGTHLVFASTYIMHQGNVYQSYVRR